MTWREWESLSLFVSFAFPSLPLLVWMKCLTVQRRPPRDAEHSWSDLKGARVSILQRSCRVVEEAARAELRERDAPLFLDSRAHRSVSQCVSLLCIVNVLNAMRSSEDVWFAIKEVIALNLNWCLWPIGSPLHPTVGVYRGGSTERRYTSGIRL